MDSNRFGQNNYCRSNKKIWEDKKYKRSNTTPIKCIENNYIFQNAKEISNLLKIDANNIRSCCRSIQKTSAGYHWEYSNWDDYDIFYKQNPNYLEQFLIEHNKNKNKNKIDKFKPVLCIDKDVAYKGQEFASIITGIDRTGIGLCCLNKQNKCGGYKWKFISQKEYEQYKQSGKADIKIPLIKSSQKTKVLCIETNIIYESITDAYKQTGIRHIGECCNGLLKTAGGFHWIKVNN